MLLQIDGRVREDFPEICMVVKGLSGVLVRSSDDELERFKQEKFRELRCRFSVNELKDLPVIRSYRNFYWRLGIDPTKIRPAGEALLRRILLGRDLPRINTLVDAYNLASAETGVAISALDRKKLTGNLVLRYSKPGEIFEGMNGKLELSGREPVVSDDEKVVAIYPYRDSEQTKITEKTREVVFLFCGVPGVETANLLAAAEKTIIYVRKFCGGEEVQQ
jgi:DNA/RNA-binding domain of Phe-tRNA-synthetase-like protein